MHSILSVLLNLITMTKIKNYQKEYLRNLFQEVLDGSCSENDGLLLIGQTSALRNLLKRGVQDFFLEHSFKTKVSCLIQFNKQENFQKNKENY